MDMVLDGFYSLGPTFNLEVPLQLRLPSTTGSKVQIPILVLALPHMVRRVPHGLTKAVILSVVKMVTLRRS